MLESDGVLVAGANKLVIKHPAFQVWRDSVSAQRQLGEQLGCSPVARECVHAKAPAKNLTKMQESGDCPVLQVERYRNPS
jgi:phage terminase small subunit